MHPVGLWSHTNIRSGVEGGSGKWAPFVPKDLSVALWGLGFHVAISILAALLYSYIYLFTLFLLICHSYFLYQPPF